MEKIKTQQQQLIEVYKSKEIEILSWIEGELGQPLAASMFEALHDGTVLCRLMEKHNEG